jgi:hypothetical protein
LDRWLRAGSAPRIKTEQEEQDMKQKEVSSKGVEIISGGEYPSY